MSDIHPNDPEVDRIVEAIIDAHRSTGASPRDVVDAVLDRFGYARSTPRDEEPGRVRGGRLTSADYERMAREAEGRPEVAAGYRGIAEQVRRREDAETTAAIEELVDPVEEELVRGFTCDICGEQFTDGITAGNHEADEGHRVSHDDVPARRETVETTDAASEELVDAPVYRCAECGHEHYFGRDFGWSRCPIDGCDCLGQNPDGSPAATAYLGRATLDRETVAAELPERRAPGAPLAVFRGAGALSPAAWAALEAAERRLYRGSMGCHGVTDVADNDEGDELLARVWAYSWMYAEQAVPEELRLAETAARVAAAYAALAFGPGAVPVERALDPTGVGEIAAELRASERSSS